MRQIDPQQGGKRARTRARLVEAAAELFAERGVHATTVDAVAVRAGMSKGAVYGNFADKEALFLATLNLPVSSVQPEFLERASLGEQMRRLGAAVVAFAPLAERRHIRVSDLQLYMATHPERQRAITDWTERMVEQVMARWRPFFDDADLGMPLREFVILIDAIIDGLLIQRALTPRLVSDDLIRGAFARFGNHPS
jgi:AcrR family transcriptional regulator